MQPGMGGGTGRMGGGKGRNWWWYRTKWVVVQDEMGGGTGRPASHWVDCMGSHWKKNAVNEHADMENEGSTMQKC